MTISVYECLQCKGTQAVINGLPGSCMTCGAATAYLNPIAVSFRRVAARSVSESPQPLRLR